MKSKVSVVPQQSQSMDRWIDEKEASRITGMSRAWFQRKRWEGGGIPYTKIDRACRYKVRDVVSFMENRKTGSTSRPALADGKQASTTCAASAYAHGGSHE